VVHDPKSGEDTDYCGIATEKDRKPYYCYAEFYLEIKVARVLLALYNKCHKLF